MSQFASPRGRPATRPSGGSSRVEPSKPPIRGRRLIRSPDRHRRPSPVWRARSRGL